MTSRLTIGQARKALNAAGYAVNGSYLQPGQTRAQRRYIITTPDGQQTETNSARLKQLAIHLRSHKP
jgi:hypothetical protein